MQYYSYDIKIIERTDQWLVEHNVKENTLKFMNLHAGLYKDVGPKNINKVLNAIESADSADRTFNQSLQRVFNSIKYSDRT